VKRILVGEESSREVGRVLCGREIRGRDMSIFNQVRSPAPDEQGMTRVLGSGVVVMDSLGNGSREGWSVVDKLNGEEATRHRPPLSPPLIYEAANNPHPL
jgi:hypothetical protein